MLIKRLPILSLGVVHLQPTWKEIDGSYTLKIKASSRNIFTDLNHNQCSINGKTINVDENEICSNLKKRSELMGKNYSTLKTSGFALYTITIPINFFFFTVSGLDFYLSFLSNVSIIFIRTINMYAFSIEFVKKIRVRYNHKLIFGNLV